MTEMGSTKTSFKINKTILCYCELEVHVHRLCCNVDCQWIVKGGNLKQNISFDTYILLLCISQLIR